MQKCRNAEMQKCRNAEMQKCRNASDFEQFLVELVAIWAEIVAGFINAL